jgi:hypothetical protein
MHSRTPPQDAQPEKAQKTQAHCKELNLRSNAAIEGNSPENKQAHRHTRKSGSGGALANFVIPWGISLGSGNFPIWFREFPYLVRSKRR